MFAWLLACTVTVTSVPATGTLVYASEDLFSDGEGTEVEYVEEVPVFDDGTGEEESTEEEVFTEEAEPVTTSLTEEEGIALLSENETVDTGLKVEENKTPEISVYQGEEVELVVKASINEGFGQISYKWYEGEYIYIYDAEEIEGATEAVLKFTCTSSYTQTYHCIVSDDYGNKRHWVCRVTGISGVTVEETSLEKVAEIGDDIEFEVKASVVDEVGPLTYQWYERVYDEDLERYKNIKIEGETSSTLQLSNVKYSMRYKCVVSDRYGNSKDVIFYISIDTGIQVEER